MKTWLTVDKMNNCKSISWVIRIWMLLERVDCQEPLLLNRQLLEMDVCEVMSAVKSFQSGQSFSKNLQKWWKTMGCGLMQSFPFCPKCLMCYFPVWKQFLEHVLSKVRDLPKPCDSGIHTCGSLCSSSPTLPVFVSLFFLFPVVHSVQNFCDTDISLYNNNNNNPLDTDISLW